MRGIAAVVILGAGAVGLAIYHSRQGSPKVAKPPAYTAPTVCAGCHADIYKSYMQTGMGRSFRRVRGETAEARFYHQGSGRHYSVTSREGVLYQRRTQLTPQGAEVNVFEQRADYVIGSGNHSRTYLYRGGGNRLYQLPLSWYSERGGFWAMSPGYDRPDHKDFRRLITFDCIFCHNGYPSTPVAALPGDDPVFPESLPEGIDCQRCHGPGAAHVRSASEQRPVAEIRAAIANPKRLPRDRQMEVCMQCHLETTSRPLPYSIVRFDRGIFSYQPGQPLGEYALHFDSAEPQDHFEIAHAAYRLRKSACFQQSSTLTCTTCHDPHKPSGTPEALARYKDTCLSCHAAAHRQAEDCMSCHMPKRRTDDVVHAVMTDHFIQRRKPGRDLLAAIKEDTHTRSRGEVKPYYPAKADELYVAVAQVTDGTNLAAGIPRLESAIARHRPANAQFYHELAEAYWKSGQPEKAIPQYREALRIRPEHKAARRNLAVALRRTGDLRGAAEALREAAGDAEALTTLGDVLLALGEADRAESTLRAAVALDPNSPEALNNLGQVLARKRDDGARQWFERAIAVRPDYPEAHNNLANWHAARSSFDEAVFHFEQALRHSPEYADAHYNYGSMLARAQRWREGERHLLEAVRLDPKLADAHNNLGILYASQGRLADAAVYFRRAVEEQPSNGSARLNLAVALAETGRVAEAKQELQKAAQDADPAVRAGALRALEALR